jgi:hypothetical protein
MKITSLLLLVFLFSTETQAQLHIPALSPMAVSQQQIGLGKAIVTYARRCEGVNFWVQIIFRTEKYGVWVQMR